MLELYLQLFLFDILYFLIIFITTNIQSKYYKYINKQINVLSVIIKFLVKQQFLYFKHLFLRIEKLIKE